ncbi:MAG: hypothetical protein Q9190_001250 [Brigantiaea leucoxantha]
MDPQQRILLETVYEALEDSGTTLEGARGSRTAVYTALFTQDYATNIHRDLDDLPKYELTGNGGAILSIRISHVFDLKGPSMTIDTGCSGSLVVLHLAALIRNTAVNQDGKTTGLTLPNEDAQVELQRGVFADVGISLMEVRYLEAHGTGTLAGDSAEIGAITKVFCRGRGLPLSVGSIKSNIGHLESASGVVGAIKAVLILEKGLVLPNADFQEAKPDLHLIESHTNGPCEVTGRH